MNTEDSEFERIEREQAMRGVPDAIHHTDTSEPLMYIQGWNDCRQAMLEQPAQVEVCCGDYGKCMKPCTPRGKWLAEQPAPVQERRKVGDSRFESWFSEGFDPKNKGTKQQMREAYEAGLNDPQAQPLTDDEIRGLTPKPDGVAESDPRRVEVLPGVIGTEYDEVDAWSMPLVLQIARAIEARHNIKESQS